METNVETLWRLVGIALTIFAALAGFTIGKNLIDSIKIVSANIKMLIEKNAETSDLLKEALRGLVSVLVILIFVGLMLVGVATIAKPMATANAVAAALNWFLGLFNISFKFKFS